MSPSHVAILVPSVRKAAVYLRQFGYEIGSEDSFEETREIYVQGEDANPLLLMEPKEKGSYARALKKRGLGLHHLAIDVLDLEKFVSSVCGSGWLLHPNSLQTMKDYRTVYLARPGFPALIEVQEKKGLIQGPLFVESISVKLESGHASLVKAVGLDKILKSGKPALTLRGREIDMKKLF